jgi:hypothetical protein
MSTLRMRTSYSPTWSVRAYVRACVRVRVCMCVRVRESVHVRTCARLGSWVRPCLPACAYSQPRLCACACVWVRVRVCARACVVRRTPRLFVGTAAYTVSHAGSPERLRERARVLSRQCVCVCVCVCVCAVCV